MLARAARSLATSRLVRLAATVGLVAVIVWRSEPQRLAGSFGRIGVTDILAALALTIPFLILKALRWQLILRNARVEATFVEAMVSLVGGMALALITPARLGEIARVAYLRDNRKLRLSALVLLDKFFDVLALVLLAVAGAWVLLGPIVGTIFALGAVVGLCFVYRPQLFGPVVGLLERKLPLAGRTREVMSSLEPLTPVATSGYLAISLAAFAIVIAQFAIILHGPAPHLNPDASILTFPLVVLTNVVPLTIAGLGIREGASVLLLGHYHVSVAVASVAAFMMFVVNTAVPGFVGALLPLFHVRPSKSAAQASHASERAGGGS